MNSSQETNQTPIEAQLIRRIKAGDRSAFDTVYHIYARRLYAFVGTMTDNRHDIEDVLQDTFVNLWVHRREITNESTIKSLLFVMARNRLVNLAKRSCLFTAVDDMVQLEGEREMEREYHASPLSLMEYGEFEQELMQSIENLPPTQREVVRLSRWESMSNDEIAVRMGLSVQTVKNSLSLALKTLKRGLPGKVAFGIMLFCGFCRYFSLC